MSKGKYTGVGHVLNKDGEGYSTVLWEMSVTIQDEELIMERNGKKLFFSWDEARKVWSLGDADSELRGVIGAKRQGAVWVVSVKSFVGEKEDKMRLYVSKE